MNKKNIFKSSKMKYKYEIRNCKDCFDYQTNKYFGYDFCPWHRDKKDQPPGIDKKISKERKSLRNWRIFLWTLALFLGFCLLYYGFNLPRYHAGYKSEKDFENGYLFYSAVGLVAKIVIILPLLGWMIIRVEKDAKKELKELNQKKKEWIIERE